MRKILVGAIGLLAIAAWSIPVAASADDPGSGFTMAVYGDSPYGNSVTHDTAQVALTPGFIDAVNADPDVSMVAHVGDIHSGQDFCTRDYDKTIRKLWRGFADPLVYTPGDNEWADCHAPDSTHFGPFSWQRVQVGV